MGLREGLVMKSNKMNPDDRMRCYRCGSIMASENYYSLEGQFRGLRCICCGDVVDQVILKNREAVAVAAPRL